jgi:hypothetical protein
MDPDFSIDSDVDDNLKTPQDPSPIMVHLCVVTLLTMSSRSDRTAESGGSEAPRPTTNTFTVTVTIGRTDSVCAVPNRPSFPWYPAITDAFVRVRLG